jgi:hypothetical protein
MDSLGIVAAALVVVALVVAYVVVRKRARAGTVDEAGDRLDTVLAWPPKGTRVLNTAERQAYATLVRALPGYLVLAQVPVARFLKVPTRYSYSEWLRRLGSQCADLVVCDMATEVIAVVSVQPPVTDLSDRARKRHTRMARVLKAAEIPLHVWTSTALPSPETARELLLPSVAAAQVHAEARAPAVPAPPAAPTTSRPSPFDEVERDSSLDERIVMMEPPLSTWFDEFNSGPTPLPPPRRRSTDR